MRKRFAWFALSLVLMILLSGCIGIGNPIEDAKKWAKEQMDLASDKLGITAITNLALEEESHKCGNSVSCIQSYISKKCEGVSYCYADRDLKKYNKKLAEGAVLVCYCLVEDTTCTYCCDDTECSKECFKSKEGVKSGLKKCVEDA